MDAPLPLPLADPLTTAIAPSQVLPLDPIASHGCNAPETFALLLSLAQSMLEPAETEVADIEGGEQAPDAAAADAASAPLDSLLFLANVTVAATASDPRVASVPAAVPTVAQSAPRTTAAAPALVATTDIARTDASDVAQTMPIDTALPSLPPAEPRQAVPATARDGRAPSTPVMATLQAAPPGDRAPVMAAATKDAATIPTPALPAPVAAAASAAEAAPPSYAPHTTSPSPAAATTTIAIDVPVQDPQWREQVAERIVTLVARGTERAELRMSPPELGPVELRIDVKGGEATLAIVAVHPATRDALENALPLLRDLLAQQGLALGQATVRDGRADADAKARDESPATPASGPAAASEESTARVVVRRLVDVFA